MLTQRSRHCRESLRARRPPRRRRPRSARDAARLAAGAARAPAARRRRPATPESARVLAEVRELRVARQVAAQVRANHRAPAGPGDAAALPRHRRAGDPRVRRVHPRALRRTDGRAAPARDRNRPAVRRAARAFLEQPLRRVGRQAAARRARRPLRARSDPAARHGQLLRSLARCRAASRDDPVSRQPNLDGAGLAGRDLRAPQPRPRARA